jgi:hypothetical protein
MNKKLMMLMILVGIFGVSIAREIEEKPQKTYSHAGHGNGFAGGGYDSRAFVNGGRYNGYYYLGFAPRPPSYTVYQGTYHVRRDKLKEGRQLPQHAGSRRARTYGKYVRKHRNEELSENI